MQPQGDIAGEAHNLQRSAGAMQRSASRERSARALPPALAHLEEALDRLAASMVISAQRLDEWRTGRDVTAAESPSGRALEWHLCHLAARIRSAQEACPETRRWARELAQESPDTA